MSHASPSRSGNTIIIALGVVVLVAGVVFISGTNASQVLRDQDYGLRQTKAAAALEAVLSRREAMLVDLASTGDVLTWAGDGVDKPANFGVDVVGDCQVRWRIEPARTVRDEDLSGVPTTNTKNYLENPSPDNTYISNDTKRLENGFVFMYRVAAEATCLARARNSSTDIVMLNEGAGRAQGARFVAVSKLPMLRYVINYLRNGAAGDLELSHNPAVTIRGNVNSNGAIYIGSGTMVGDWAASGGGSGATTIGPLDGVPVIVKGNDGIFRLSKPTMYSALNQLPMNNGMTLGDADLGPSNPFFNVSSTVFPADPTGLVGGTFDSVTRNGRYLNPYRVKAGSGSATMVTGGSVARLINDTPIKGGVDAPANDSRDAERTIDRKFPLLSRSTASDGFKGYAQTQANGSRPEKLAPQYAQRGLEPQQLRYREADGDPLTDEHDFAVPVFEKPERLPSAVDPDADDENVSDTENITTAELSGRLAANDPAGTVIEQPGSYLKLMLKDMRMTRLKNGEGWFMTDKRGYRVASPGLLAGKENHLVIRERPIPKVDFWPTTSGDPTKFVPFGDNDALPYSPGKHWRPVSMPFTPIDIVEDQHTQADSSSWSNISIDPVDRNAQTANRSVAYRFNGQLSITSATGVKSGGGTQGCGFAYPGNSNPTSSNTIMSFPRADEYYNGTWRFVHLKNRYGLTDAEIAASPEGLRYSFWQNNNRAPGQASNTGNLGDFSNRDMAGGGTPEHAPFLGEPTVWGISGNGPTSDRPWSPLPMPTGVGKITTSNPNDFFSIRWEGFIIPPATGEYAFRMSCDDGYRVWLNDRLASERWSYVGGWTNFPTAYGLTAGKPVKIVIEMYEVGGGNNCQLQWQPPSGSFQNIPASYLRAPADTVTGGFNRGNFQSAVVRIDPSTLVGGPTQQKVGLMLRPSHSEPAMLHTRDRYLAFCFSPARGFFLERRMEESRRFTRESPSRAYWIGSGDYTIDGSAPSAALGGVLPTPVPASGNAYDPAEINGLQHTYGITRTATITRTNVGVPTTGAISRWETNTFNSTGGANPAVQNQNLGDGITVNVKFGAWTKTGTISRTIYKNLYARRTHTFTFSGGITYPFAYVGTGRPTLTMYRDASTATTNVTEFTLGNNGYTVSGDGTQVFYVQEAWPTTQSGPVTSAGSFTSGDGATNKVWKPTGGWPAGYSASSFVQKLNDINFQGRSDWILGDNSGDGPNNPTGSVTVPEPVDPVAAAMTAMFDDADHSFHLNVTAGYYMPMDTNPWTNGLSLWATTPTPITRPWLSTWETTFGLKQPLTSSIRPDMGIAVTDAFANTGAVRAVSAPGGYPRLTPSTAMVGDAPLPAGPLPQDVWLMVTRGAGDVLTFSYAFGNLPNAPAAASASWMTLPTAETIRIDAPVWSSFLFGPCVQSGSATVATNASFSGLSVSTTEQMGALASPFRSDGVWDFNDWDANTLVGPGSPMSRYLASQYQVFFGGAEITQDFFTWAEQPGLSGVPIAAEDWFYNPREFWSQGSTWQTWDSTTGYSSNEPWGVPAPLSRWLPRGWRDTVLKDGNLSLMSEKTMWAKTTVLQLNLGRLWSYVATRAIDQATHRVLDLGTPAPAVSTQPTLSSRFGGGIYVARTNRYPFNPNQPLTNPAIDPLPIDLRKVGGLNPWSWSSTDTYPNGVEGTINIVAPLANDTNSDRAIVPTGAVSYNYPTYTWFPSSLSFSGVHKLQPYDNIGLFPIRPQQFHHGVMLTNGSNINWGINSDGSSTFGSGAVSFITPNALYIQGDFNSTKNPVRVGGAAAATPKDTPVMVNGDSVTLLSNAWRISNYKSNALTIGWDSSKGKYTPTSGGALALPTDRYASSTTYVMAIITHNQPTTRERVLEGQSSPFIDTMLFAENWSGTTMTFRGSLVVLDTRRYTDAFLLDGGKDNGRSPFGWMGWVATKPVVDGGRGLSVAEWNGLTPKVYAAGTRDFQFQKDFLTKDGTPPLAPYGMTATGIGGWSRILE